MIASGARMEPTSGATGRAQPGAEVFLTMINLLRRRRSVPLDLFYAYWRDAHVQIAARLPGIHGLRIHQVAFEEAGRWPRVTGVGHVLPEGDRFEGVPEPTFLTPEDLDRFLTHMGPLMEDEVNLFEETIGYRSLGGNTCSLVDRLPPAGADGDPHLLRYLVFLKASAGVTQGAFRSYLAEHLTPALASEPTVLKLRLHLLEPYDSDEVALDAASVSHIKAPDKQYQAAYEIAFADALELARFAASRSWTESREGQRAHLREAHPFRVIRSYAMKEEGELTLAGLRTPAVAEQIVRLGALNQLAPGVARLIRTGQSDPSERS